MHTPNSPPTWKQEFSYDRYGNRNFVTGTGKTSTLGSCTTACNPTFDTATNRFASSQGFTYDANGSLTVDAINGYQYQLDAENRQVQVLNSGSASLVVYSYDGEGRRVVKTNSTINDTTVFIYDAGGTLVEEWTTNSHGSVKKVSNIYAGSRLISTETSAAGTTYVTLDHLGSTRVTTNGSGTVTSRKDFMAFGDEAMSTQRTTGLGYTPPSVRQDYTGYEKESETGLEFAQARYENPIHGRFTSVDPLTASATIKNPQSFNRYTYALNSPYKFTDPLGLFAAFPRCSPPLEGPGHSGAFDSDDTTNNEWIFGEHKDPNSASTEAASAPTLHEAEHRGEHSAGPKADPAPQQDLDGAIKTTTETCLAVIIAHLPKNPKTVQTIRDNNRSRQPLNLLLAQAAVESTFGTALDGFSGELGLFQTGPATVKDNQKRLGLEKYTLGPKGTLRNDFAQNTRIATTILQDRIDKTGSVINGLEAYKAGLGGAPPLGQPTFNSTVYANSIVNCAGRILFPRQ